MSGPDCQTCLDTKWLWEKGDWIRCPECNAEVDKDAGRDEGDANRDRQMDRVARGNPESRIALVKVGTYLCPHVPDVVSDDVWDSAEGIEPREKRIMGVVMKDLCKMGLIEPSEPRIYRKAHRKVNNSRPQLVWVSLVYSGRR